MSSVAAASVPDKANRRLVFGAAVVLAFVVSGMLSARAETADSPPTPPTPPAVTLPAVPPVPSPDTSTAPATKGDVVIERHGKRVTVKGVANDDDLERFARSGMSSMIVWIVGIVFLSPVLLVGVVIWYRLRKARMANEAMLKLAERGAVPPAQAMQAIASGQLASGSVADTVAATGNPNISPVEQVRQIRTRAAWSDLRKGVILAAVGLAFTVANVIKEGSPGTVGLILLFIGVGYCALWWYETRHLSAPASTPPGSGPNPNGP